MHLKKDPCDLIERSTIQALLNLLFGELQGLPTFLSKNSYGGIKDYPASPHP